MLVLIGSTLVRLKWLSLKTVEGLDGAKARMISSLMICTVAPCFVYLSNRKPEPCLLGDFTNKTTTYGCLAISIALYVFTYFGVDIIPGALEAIVKKIAI
jgi:hypothetical protein